jgi:GNAT superfamily N-acetyltransferase
MTDVRVHTGRRTELRPLFELAESSPAQLDRYIDAGEVLVAVEGERIVGHLQIVETERAHETEIKNMAVEPAHQGRGIGRMLVAAALDLARERGHTTVLVATAAADTGDLRFYQRLGFRMRSVERDAFTSASGYPDPIDIDGIELRDRVWLDMPVG